MSDPPRCRRCWVCTQQQSHPAAVNNNASFATDSPTNVQNEPALRWSFQVSVCAKRAKKPTQLSNHATSNIRHRTKMFGVSSHLINGRGTNPAYCTTPERLIVERNARFMPKEITCGTTAPAAKSPERVTGDKPCTSQAGGEDHRARLWQKTLTSRSKTWQQTAPGTTFSGPRRQGELWTGRWRALRHTRRLHQAAR